MKKILIIMVCMVLFNAFAFADEKNEKTAKDFIIKIFVGDIEGSVKLSGVPFSYDGKELVKDFDSLKTELGKIIEQNGKNNVSVTSVQQIKKTRGKHKELKDEIIIYELGIQIKNSNAPMQIFIRKSDGKVVGLYG